MEKRTAPSPKTAPTSTAWSRLVQLTRNASSKTSPTRKAESPKLSEYHGTSNTAPAMTPVQRVRLRRPISSPSPILISREQNQDSEPDIILGLAADEANSIQVCPCPVGDPPLPDGKCSLSRQHVRKQESKSPNFGQTKTATLSAFRVAQVAHGTSPEKSSAHDTTVTNIQSAVLHSGKDSSESAWHCADDETGSYAPQEGASAPISRDQAHISTTGSQNTQYVSLPLSDHPTEELKMAATVTHSPLEASHSAATSPASTEPKVHSSGHNSYPSGHSESAPTLLLRKKEVARVDSESTKTNRRSEVLHRKEDTTSMSGPNISGIATPLSCPESLATPSSPVNEDEVTDSTTSSVEFKRKAKRRLTLHSAEHDHGCDSGNDGQPPPKKKKKIQPKKKHTVQTTLSLAIGGSAGMRECKVCDTVYNPFHPEDVKVHAKRHAGVLKSKSPTTTNSA